MLHPKERNSKESLQQAHQGVQLPPPPSALDLARTLGAPLPPPPAPPRVLTSRPLRDLQGMEFPPDTPILGPLISQGDLACIFGRPGTGKSVLVLNLLRALAEGSTFGEGDALTLGLENKAKPVRVGWLDLENSTATTARRLRELPEPENLLRYEVSAEEFYNSPDFLKDFFAALKEDTLEKGVQVWALDNIQHLQGEHLGKDLQQVAAEVMHLAEELVKETGCTFIVVAHGIKEQAGFIDLFHLQGSAKLGRKFWSVVGLGGPLDRVNSAGQQVRYLKQVKTRQGVPASKVFAFEMLHTKERGLHFVRREEMDCTEAEWLHTHEPKRTAPKTEGLSERDTLILDRLTSGKTSEEICREVGCSSSAITRAKERAYAQRLASGEPEFQVARELGISQSVRDRVLGQTSAPF